MRDDINIIARNPTLEEFTAIRTAVGWGIPGNDVAANALHNTLFAVCAKAGDTVVGCGRVTGDGYMYFYISDVIVVPEYQNRGIGRRIMNGIMEYLGNHAPAGAFIGLFAARGKEGFYKNFGFIERPNSDLGPGMIIYRKDIAVRPVSPAGSTPADRC